MAVKINLGCGGKPLEGYINHDIAIDGVDMRELPYKDSEVGVIECHHAIEHLGRDEVESTLREWARVLEGGGRLVITCPDIEACMEAFLAATVGERWEIGGGGINQSIWGDQSNEFAFHKTGFSLERLKLAVEGAGMEVVMAKKIEQDHGAPGLRIEAIKK